MKKNKNCFSLLAVIILFFSAAWMVVSCPFSEEEPQTKVFDITEIKVGSQLFSKETNLQSLNGQEIHFPTSESSFQLAIIVDGEFQSAQLVVNDDPAVNLTSQQGQLLYSFFKNAIRNKEVMAVSYEWGGGVGNYPLGHVVTVWGISLDGDENVFEFWVADSDVDKGKGYPYLYNMGIHYGGDGSPKFVNLSISTDAKYTKNVFRDITTLKLGTSAFEDFFNGR